MSYYLSAILMTIFIFIGCDLPFFPETGHPEEKVISGLRATPRGLLDQLIESYESRRIDLFTDLLSKDQSYRFFVAPDFYDEYRQGYPQLSEKRDDRLLFLEESDFYHYWTYEKEIENHERLFNRATYIDFRSKPALGGVRKFVDNGDSLAELLITGGLLEIGRTIKDTTEIYSTTIDRQVFLIKKETNSLWVISKWYDFSRGN